MQFQLPSNLQQKLIAYDPKLKELARQTNQPTKAPCKTKYPLGNVPHLIPYEVVSESLQQDAINNINTCEAKFRYQEFRKTIGDVATTERRVFTKAILYHYEQCWYAAWLPQQGEDYLFGYAFAFKDTVSARKALPREIINMIDTYERVSIGRTLFYVLRENVTKEDIINKKFHSVYPWRPSYFGNYYRKSVEIQKIIKNFEESLTHNLPVWKDSCHMFDRIRCNEIYKVLDINKDLIPEDKRTGWELTINNLIEVFSMRDEVYGPNSYRDNEYQLILNHLDVWNTPYFRKWMQQQLNECIDKFNDLENKESVFIKRGFKKILRLAVAINYVKTIWPDCPIDYFQQYLDELMCVRTHDSCNKVSAEWLRANMPVKSFFQILNKHYQNQLEKERYHSMSSDLGIRYINFYDWNDTISMIHTIITNHVELKAPRRWRLSEFHEHVQEKAWKIKNPNVKLPQDLFPEPVKIDIDNQVWTFMQPIDTHQLSRWGQAVRNCVGSSSNYAEGIRKKKHFIVLCMIDNKPQFTIQLRVDMGSMSVDQIRGLSNSLLTPDQTEQYTQAFSLALQSLESSLRSN